MKFRTLLLAGVSALVAAIVIATVGTIAVVLDRAARSEVDEGLGRGRRVFEDLQEYRTSLFRSNARVVAEEPCLKAVVATQDVSRETVLGVVAELKKVVQSELFLLTDGTGRLVVDVADPQASGDLSQNAVVKAALERGEGGGIWLHDGHAYQVQGRRLVFGATTVGVLVIGYEIDDRVAETVHRQTADAVAVLLDGKVIALSSFAGERPAARPDVAAALSEHNPSSSSEIRLAGERWLAAGAPFPGYAGTADLRYAVLRSLDRALEPERRLLRVVLGIAGAALLAALALASTLAGRLARPLDGLVAFTRHVAAGDLARRADSAEGPLEVRHLGEAMNRMVAELAVARRELAKQERLQRELEIATRIQTSILPRDLGVRGMEIAARMVPAEEVGGDYYDILPVDGGRGGAWIGIGDVAGHGLTAGLVMMMIQSVVSALVKAAPSAAPRDLLAILNAVLYENIRDRLTQDEHVTFSLLRVWPDGTVRFAGAHEEIVVWRARTQSCERVPTPGTWLGAAADITRHTPESTLTLEAGDLLVLYSDGLIQAMNSGGEQFGMQRLVSVVARTARAHVDAVVAEVIDEAERFAAERADDVTLVVLRYRGGEARV